jgi:hypothetical protein
MFNEFLFVYYVVKLVAVVVCFAGGFGMCGSSMTTAMVLTAKKSFFSPIRKLCSLLPSSNSADLAFLILHALFVFFQSWVAFMALRALPVIEIDRNVIFGIVYGFQLYTRPST